MLHKALLLYLLLIIITPPTALADQAYIAVAANFAAPMKEITKAFEANSEHRLILSYASSGKFYAQIKNGAPYEAFLSADDDKVARLIKDKLALESSRFTYALGTLALWYPHQSYAENGADILKSGQFNKLAIANPRLAPYGTAAMQVLESLAVNESVKKRLVQGENISQAYQFVHSGNADLGLVAYSQIQSNPTSTYWVVPSKLHQPIRQDAVLLYKGQNNPAAVSLLNFLKSEQCRKIIESFGYRI